MKRREIKIALISLYNQGYFYLSLWILRDLIGSPARTRPSGVRRPPPGQPIFCRPEAFSSYSSAKIGFESFNARHQIWPQKRHQKTDFWCQIWLPDYTTKRTISSARVRFPVYVQFVRHQLVIVTDQPPYDIKTTNRITRRVIQEAKPKVRKPSPLDQALKYAAVLNEPSIVSKTQVAMRFGVSRARVCQVLSLLELDSSIIQHLKSIEDIDEHNFWTKRRLRSIALPEKKEEQLAEFNRLRRETSREMVLV